MRIPIACTLTEEGATDRVEEWRAFLTSSVTDVERRSPVEARLRLTCDDAVLAAAVDLARREAACCGFFGFRIDIGVDSCWLGISVPDDAAPILADLVALSGH